MSDYSFDALTKASAKAVTRRQTLRGLAAVLGGALLTAVGARTAVAAPRECATCICGVGRPCNPKSTRCVEVGRGFPDEIESACTGACGQGGQRFCGTQGQVFHCPHGCPA